MRSLTGDDAFGRPRPADFDAPRTTSAQSSHMSFILADEATLDSHLEQPTIPRPRDPWKAHESGHILSARRDDKDVEPSRTAPVERGWAPAPEPSFSSRASAVPPSPASVRSHNTQTSWSRPVTPIMLGTSMAGSIMSSPSSRRGSLCGSISEHAISSDDEDDFLQETPSASLGVGTAPQLVMPSIKMPSRRPFTEAGKAMGRLKVLVAGDSGVGKTALIKAVVQSCEHIVHADPITPQPSKRPPKTTEWDSGLSRQDFQSTGEITEILASTKPYPEWWTELDEATASHRRRSLGDSILERNICFVDTPGYGKGSSALETMIPCVEYVESHLNRLSADALSNPEMLNMLGGGGGFQVDAVLYMIDGGLKPVDIEYLRRLAPLTNIIPLLAQADTRTVADIESCKRRISSQLQEAGIRSFVFSGSSSEAPFSSGPVVYAVSSANGSDHDVMDASLLMSPDYVQPLAPTDLEALVQRVFTPNGSSWLRHSAVKKYLQWRDSANPARPMHLYRPLSLQPGPSTALTHIPSGSYALARINNEPREDVQPQFRLVDWAAELQRSMAGERAQYEALERGERAVWLTEKLNECVKDGTLVPVTRPRASSAVKKRRVSKQTTTLHQDPLGLLQVAADLKAKGWVTLELLGSLGLIGGVVFWLTRQRWQVEPVYPDEWTRLLGLDI